MPRIGALETYKLNLRVARGRDAYWAVMRELDEGGASWSIRQIELRSNVDRRTISRFVDQLRAAGYAEVVEEEFNNGAAARRMYRLVKSPVTAPRFRSDGTEQPETMAQRLWRAMKMAKTFTCSDLVELASSEEEPLHLPSVRTYVGDLARVGILVVAKKGEWRKGEENSYRLVMNLGMRAPIQLKAEAIFDPNRNVIVGEAIGREVQP